MIVQSQYKNIRATKRTLSGQSLIKVKEYQIAIGTVILSIIDNYTSVVFTSEEQQDSLVNDCIELVFNQFEMLSIQEIKLAFQMAAAKKLTVDLTTWHGKFTIRMLGSLLNAYLKYRNGILAKHNETLNLLTSRSEDEQKEEKNKQTKQAVIGRFETLSNLYNFYINILSLQEDEQLSETIQGNLSENQIRFLFSGKQELQKLLFGITPDQYIDTLVALIAKKVKPFWAEILIKEGVFDFSIDEKRTFWNESLNTLENELANGLFSAGPNSHLSKKEMKVLLQEYRRYKKLLALGQQCEMSSQYKNLAKSKYSNLLVLTKITQS